MNDETRRWFFARGRDKVGPLSLEQLMEFARTGQLSPSDMLLRQGEQRWIVAGELPELFEQSPQPLLTQAFTESPEYHAPGAGLEVPSSLSCQPDVPQTVPGESTRPIAPPPSSSAAPLCSGYEILEELGRGGMGIVYKARQVKLDRIVALKMIRTGSSAGHEERQRFQTEAEAIARLRHPNIVQIYEVSEHEAFPFFSLEFVEGGTLAGCLRGIPVQPREAANLVEALAQAMHAAHQAGVIHRDLKPQNVLMARTAVGEDSPSLADLVPKITDFGLARKLDEVTQTQTGAVIGTPSYMSAEQAEGRSQDIGPATDIYALGAILYECLTGRPPFRGATVMETLDLVRYAEPIPPRQLTPRTPRDLEVICLKCLQKEPGKRYATALELAADLRRFCNGEPVRARPIGRLSRAWRWSKRNPALASLGLLLTISLSAGITGIELNRRAAVAERERAEGHAAAALAEKEEAIRLRGIAETREAEKDQFVYASFMNQVPAAWARGDLLAVQRYLKAFEPKPAGKGSPGFEWDYYWKQLYGSRLTLLGHTDVQALAFSPDGTLLVSCGHDRTVRLWDLQTGQERWQHLGSTACYGVAFDRHATTIAVQSQGSFFLLAVRDGAQVGRGLADAGLAFVPDGSALAVGRGQAIHFFDASAKRLRLSVPDAHKGRVNALTFSADSRWLYSAGRDGVVRLWHNDGTLQPGSVRPKAVTPRDARGPVNAEVDIVCTPDARKMACLTQANVIEVWQADLAQGTLTLDKALAPRQGKVTALALTPDGKSLMTAGTDGAIRLFDIALGQERLLIGSHSLALDALALSSDGKQLASAGRDGVVRVWDVPETKRVAFHESVNALAFSPTADLLVSAGKDGTVRLWHAQTGATQGVLEERDGPVQALAFTPDGRELAVGHQDGTIALWDVAGRTSRGRLDVKGEVTSLAISPDGQRLAAGTELGFLATFDLPRRQRLRQEAVHVERVSAVAFTLDGRQVVTGSQDYTVQLHDWDADTRTTLFQSPRPVTALTVLSPTEVVVGTETNVWRIGLRDRPAERLGTFGYGVARILHSPDARVMHWVGNYGYMGGLDSLPVAASPGTAQKHEADFPSQLLAGALARDGKLIAVAGREGVISLWDTERRAVVSHCPGHARAATALASSPDGQTLAHGRADFAVVLTDAATQRELAVLTGLAGTVSAVCFSPDGQFVAGATLDGTVRVWELRTGTATAFGDTRGEPIHALLFTPDSRTLLSGGGTKLHGTGRVLSWDVRTGKMVPALRQDFRHRWTIRDMALAGGGKVLITATNSAFDFPGELKLWDLEQGRELATLYPDRRGLLAVAVSADGRTLATGAASTVIRLWDISNPSQPSLKHILHGHQSWPRALAFSPDGRTLVSTGYDQTLRFWQPQQGLALGAVPLGSFARCLTFHPKDNTLYASHDDGRIRVHRSVTPPEIEAQTRHTADQPALVLDLPTESTRLRIASQRELAAQQRTAGNSDAAAETLRQTDRLLEDWLRRQPLEQLVLKERGEVLLELVTLLEPRQPDAALALSQTAELLARRLLTTAPALADGHDLLVQSLQHQTELLKRTGQEARAAEVNAATRLALDAFFACDGVSPRTVTAFLEQVISTPASSQSLKDRKLLADRCSAVLAEVLTGWRRWTRSEVYLYHRVELLVQLQQLQEAGTEERLKTLRELAALSRVRVATAPAYSSLRDDLARVCLYLGEAEEPQAPARAAQYYREALSIFEALRLAQPESFRAWSGPAWARERLARLALVEGKYAEAKSLIEQAIPELEMAFQKDTGRLAQTLKGWRSLAGLLTTCGEQAKRDARLSATERKAEAETCTRTALALLERAVKQGFKDVADLEKAEDLKPLRRLPEFKKLVDAIRRKT